MTRVLINESNLQNIANAIRGKNGLSDTYTPSQMASAISAIPTGSSITAEIVTVTVNADKTSAYNILTGNQFLADHYADTGAFVLLVSLTKQTSADSVVVDMASNINFAHSMYGFGVRTSSADSSLYVAIVTKTLASQGVVYNGCMYYENGNLKVYATSSRVLRAGEYAIIMGVIE